MSRSEPLYKRGQTLIKQYIVDKKLGPGDPLPPEGEMAELFGMSRLSLREALKGLETIGIVVTKHGGAVRVAEFSFQPILENLPYSFQASGRSFKDLLELRESLEEGLCGRLAKVARPRDLDTLESISRAMGDRTLSVAQVAELDRRFHTQMYAPLENRLVTQLIEMFWQAFQRMQLEQEIPRPTSEELERIHLSIVDALRAGDETEIIAAVRSHFASIHDWVAVHYLAADGDDPSFPAAGGRWP